MSWNMPLPFIRLAFKIAVHIYYSNTAMKHTEQFISKAITLLNQGKIEQAKLLCKKVMSLTPRHYQANLLVGVMALNKHDYLLAEKHLNTASLTAKTVHEKAQALNNLSLALTYQQRLTEALSSIDKAIELKQQQPLFYCNRANIYEQLSRWSDMKHDLLTALSLTSNEIPDAYISLAVAMRHLDEYAAALTLLEQHPDVTDQDWLNEWALLCGLNQQLKKVEQHFIPVSASDFLNITEDSFIALGDYAVEQNHTDVARSLYLIAQQVLPGHPVITHQLNALHGIASAQAPREYVESLFDSCAAQFEQRLVSQLQYQLPEQLVDKLLPFLPDTPMTIIDLGCGTGLLGKALSPHIKVTSLTGIDLSSKMLEETAKTQRYQHLIHGDLIENINSTDEANLITATDVLVYIGELTVLFKKVNQALKQNGLFAFSIESCDTQWRLAPSGRYQHNHDFIRSLARDCGFVMLHSSACQLRLEKSLPIVGEIVILQKA
jgi:predicted TPR repeat methyltransferase/Tfp pilus assembly protein PilF